MMPLAGRLVYPFRTREGGKRDLAGCVSKEVPPRLTGGERPLAPRRSMTRPCATFIPSGERWDNLGIKSWWSPTTGLMKNMLGTLGFEVVDIVESHPIVLAEGPSTNRPTCHAIVAERV